MNKLLLIFLISPFLQSNAVPVNGNNDILNALSSVDPLILIYGVPDGLLRMDQQGLNLLVQDVNNGNNLPIKESLPIVAGSYTRLSPSNQVNIFKEYIQ